MTIFIDKKIPVMRSLLVFITCFFSFAVLAQPKPADEILSKAYAQAKKENKNVIVIFHASWCGWCKKMDASMKDGSCSKFFESNYVTVHLTVEENAANKNLENPGADALKLKYHGDKAGLPFWMILDEDGKLLGDSYIRKAGISMDEAGENIGCPASDEEVAAFIALLKKTSKLSKEESIIIAKRFKQNKV
jgi:thiol-disulfide isomerase/thioredoxin